MSIPRTPLPIRHWFYFAGISIQLDNVESDLDLQKVQIASHDVRIDEVEDGLDELDDKITALEVANVDITDRMTTVEEILLGNVIS